MIPSGIPVVDTWTFSIDNSCKHFDPSFPIFSAVIVDLESPYIEKSHVNKDMQESESYYN